MAYVPGAVLIAALVAGCSAGDEGDASATDSKPGTLTASAAPPGKYRTLPEACRSIPLATLKDLLPGAAQLAEAQQEKVFEGTPTETFDTDRRVGCGWKSDGADASRSIVVDFERVVSYDPSVSDDDRAREVYAKKEAAAHLPSASVAPGDTEKGTPPAPRSLRRTPPRRARRTRARTRRTARTRPRTRRAVRTARTPAVRPTAAPRTARTAGPPRTSSPVSWTRSGTARFWTICSPRQVPPHSTAR